MLLDERPSLPKIHAMEGHLCEGVCWRFIVVAMTGEDAP